MNASDIVQLQAGMSGPVAMGAEPPVLRLLTVNMHKGFSMLRRRYILPALRQAIAADRADLVFLQEVHGEHALHARRVRGWQPVPQYEFLADGLWGQHAYGRNAVYPDGHHGNAILSHYPIVSHANHDVSQQGDEARGILHALIWHAAFGCHLFIACVHLGLAEAHRQRQFALLRSLLETQVPEGTPVIIAGDFNDWRRKLHHAMLDLGFRDAHETYTGGLARTYPALWPLLPLDRIYCRSLKIIAASRPGHAPWSSLSDHTPLIAEVLP